jgi:HD superfamily phosphohydrolase
MNFSESATFTRQATKGTDMPKWGLDREMRRSEPWGLPDFWLRPSKVITDPIHADIYLTKLEREMVDTPTFQRLRRVRQLGTTHLVYPGATHTRFAHSLGALRSVQDLFDAAYDQRNGHHAVPDLFDEWEQDARESGGDWRAPFGRKVAEAIVLARLGALLHDICHVPFGHSLEDDLGVLTPHDKNSWRFDALWQEILDALAEQVDEDRFKELKCLAPKGPLYEQLRPLILSKEEFEEPKSHVRRKIEATERLDFPFVADMVGNTICADLTDYLQRDHTFLGLPISLGSRFMSAFYVTPSRHAPLGDGKGPLYQRRMAVLLHREGQIRADIETELLKHLRYRYELQERALVHHAKLAADAMVGSMLELWISADAEGGGGTEPDVEPARVSVRYTARDGKQWKNVKTKQRKESARRIEGILRRVSDDGLLERLAVTDGRSTSAVATLATDLLNRRLYKRLARAQDAYAAKDLHTEFGDVATRRQLEREAARYARIDSDWHVIIWLPPAEMRLKLAEMLVDHGHGIAKFVDYSEKGSEIYKAHRELWTVSVYGHRSLRGQQKRAALVRLAELMGVCWDCYVDKFGPEPDQWSTSLAAMEAFKADDLDEEVQRFLRGLEPEQLRSRSKGDMDYRGRCNELRVLAKKQGFKLPSATEDS